MPASPRRGDRPAGGGGTGTLGGRRAGRSGRCAGSAATSGRAARPTRERRRTADRAAPRGRRGPAPALCAVPLAAAAGWAAAPGVTRRRHLLLAVAAAGTAAALAQVAVRTVAPALVAAVLAAVLAAAAAVAACGSASPFPRSPRPSRRPRSPPGRLLPRRTCAWPACPGPSSPADARALVAADTARTLLPPAELATRARLARGQLAGSPAARGGRRPWRRRRRHGGWLDGPGARRRRGGGAPAPRPRVRRRRAARVHLAAGSGPGSRWSGSPPSPPGRPVGRPARWSCSAAARRIAIGGRARGRRRVGRPVAGGSPGARHRRGRPHRGGGPPRRGGVRRVRAGPRACEALGSRSGAVVLALLTPVAPSAPRRCCAGPRRRSARSGSTGRCGRPPPHPRPVTGRVGHAVAERLRLPAVHALATGRGQRIAVIDTGVAPHPRLAGRLVGLGDYLGGGDGLDDCDGHGTAVAGLIAAAAGPRGTASSGSPRTPGSSPCASSAPRSPARTAHPAGDLPSLARRRAAGGRRRRHRRQHLRVRSACPPRRPRPSERRCGPPSGRRRRGRRRRGGGRQRRRRRLRRGRSRPGLPARLVSDDLLAVGAVGPDDRPARFTVPGPWVDVAAPGTGVRSLSVDGGTGPRSTARASPPRSSPGSPP